jgi:shikimate kinase
LQLQTAANKDDALSFAISAAENLMNALKLSSNPDEKKQLKAQCRVIMDAADRIKKDAHWTAASAAQASTPKSERIDQWVTDVAVTAGNATAYEHAASPSFPSHVGLSSSSAASIKEVNSLSGNYSYLSTSP